MGFTILELMITIAVAALLVVVAAPSFNETISRNRITNEAERILLILKQARNTAIQNGTTGIVCRSAESAFTAGGLPRCRNAGLSNTDWNLDLVMYIPPVGTRLGAPGASNDNYRLNSLYQGNNQDRIQGVKSVSQRENPSLNTRASEVFNNVFFNQDGSFGDDSTPSPFRISVCNEDNDEETGRVVEVNAAGLIRIFETGEDGRTCLS